MVDTPWRSLSTPDRGREYLALLSYLPLKGFRKMLTLQRGSSKVGKQLAETRGLVGYSFRAKLSSHRFWTLSIWEDAGALRTFVGQNRHGGPSARPRRHMAAPGSTRRPIPG